MTSAHTKASFRIPALLIASCLCALLACSVLGTRAFAEDGSSGSLDLIPGSALLTADEGEATDKLAEDETLVIPVYRLYNIYNGEHFYTIHEYEKDFLVNIGWIYEGIGWQAPEASNTPVYRVYNPNAGDHHYTTSAGERDYLVTVGWRNEGICWYSDENESIPILRQYNPNAVAGAHNFTYDEAENDYLVQVGWRAEGVSWYAAGPGKGADVVWYSKTHLLALATSAIAGNVAAIGHNAEIERAKMDRLNQLLATDVPIAFLAINARTGATLTCNADTQFYGASTIKAPYVASLCKYDAPGITGHVSAMEAIIRWSSNEDFNNLVGTYGTFYENVFASESTVTLHPYTEGTAYSYLTPRELGKLWINTRDYLISGEPNAALFRSLFDRGYFKEGWMGWGDMGGQVYHIGGVEGDVVYAIMTRYSHPDSELWVLKDAIVSAIG